MHAILVFLSLGSLTQDAFYNFVHFFANLKMFSTPLYKCTTFSLFILQEGHLGYFQVLAIANNAYMNIVVQMSLWCDWVCLGIAPKVILLGTEVD